MRVDRRVVAERGARRGKASSDLVAIVFFIAAGAFGSYLWLRHELELGAGWSDGSERFELPVGERIRYTVWEAPEPLAPFRFPAEASRPALSPDGRLLVFAVGERGLNADLFVARLVNGEPGEPVPLDIVNTGADELAPAFGPDGLWFASDRGGGAFGLDLWRAPYRDGHFDPAEPAGAGINTAADETDPCPLGTGVLAFASNRARGARVDFDLYRAEQPGPAAVTWKVEPLAALNSPFDEREPATTGDARLLVFASDRAEARGGFDLFRSFRRGAQWLEPQPLHGLDGNGSERGPALSSDGFTLLFQRVEDREPSVAEANGFAARADFVRARSRELFRLPVAPPGWREWALLVTLLVIALLAWLSKSWRGLEVLYKCLLVSLLAHLFLLWYLKHVYPESQDMRFEGDERTFRVRLAPDDSDPAEAERERAGTLSAQRHVDDAQESPERAESGAPAELAARPAERELARPERAEHAPGRETAVLEAPRSNAAPVTALAQREAPIERRMAPAPALDVVARAGERAPAPSAARAAVRAAGPQLAPTPAASAAPSSERFAAPRNGDTLVRPNRATLAVETSPTPDRGPTLASPHERFEPDRAAAPDLQLSARDVAAGARATRGARTVDGAPARLDTDKRAPAAAELRPGAVRAPALRSTPTAASGPRRHTDVLDRNDAGRNAVAATALAPLPKTDPGQAAEARPELALAARAFDPVGREDGPGPADGRFDEAAWPEPSAGVPRIAPAERAVLRPPSALPEGPRANVGVRERRPSTSPPLALRSPQEASDTTAPTEASTPAHVPLETRRFERTVSVPLPTKRASAPRLAAPAPRTPVVAAAAPARPPLRTPDRERRQLKRSPYQNRFGSEKLRALEEFGGGTETEQAVAAGLAYLASVQNESGSWGSRRDHDAKYGDVRIGKTGLALLAFLGAGHTPGSGSIYDDNVARAIRFLLERQDPDSAHFGDSSAYGHGIATYALAEGYALTAAPDLRGPLEAAIAHILAEQRTDDDPRLFGGWPYYFADGHVWNRDRWPRVSISAWQIMALESARLGGLDVPDRAFRDARGFLTGAWDPRRGAFRYSHDPARLRSSYAILPASTPAALFGLSLLGIDITAPELAEARDYLFERVPRGYRYSGDDDFVHRARGNLYFWYYGTLAAFRMGGNAWERWNVAMKETLLPAQDDDGSWRPISVYAEYAGDDRDDKSYTTALCVLSLEVYYRYFTPLLQVR